MHDWWFVETPHYIILSNLRTQQRSMVKALQVDLERLWPIFEGLIAPTRPMESVSVVRIFSTVEAYQEYVGPEHQWTGGMWLSSQRELVIRPIDQASNAQGRQAILRTAYHEAFHQYVDYALDGIPPAPWYNEGHGMLFEHSELANRGINILEPDHLVKRLRSMISGDGLRLDELLMLSYPDFYADTIERRLDNYARAWGLVYYLRKGIQREKNSPYQYLLQDYIANLRLTSEPESIMSQLLSSADIESLERLVTGFWLSDGRRAAARRQALRMTETQTP
ncbi:MAG: DUF1570 domain-containing protein [Verrucomicrobia bacterium]|nr:DUF1570 domain-containing protein [Verrucomicrobiota bacterium]